MRKVAIAQLLSVVFLTACGSVEDAWVGEYDVLTDETTWLCSDPSEPPVTVPGDATWLIAEDDVGLFLAGSCRIPLRASSTTRAMFGVTRCEAIAGGDHIVVDILGGTLALDGNRISGRQDFVVTFDDGSCLTGELDMRGVRR